MAWPLGLGIIGFIMAIATEPTNVGARYTSLFFMTSSYAGYILVSSSTYLSPHALLTSQDLLMDGVQLPQASRKTRRCDFVRQRHLPTRLGRRLGESPLQGVDWSSSCSSGQYVWPSNYGPSFRRSFIFVAVMYAAVIIVSQTIPTCTAWHPIRLTRSAQLHFPHGSGPREHEARSGRGGVGDASRPSGERGEARERHHQRCEGSQEEVQVYVVIRGFLPSIAVLYCGRTYVVLDPTALLDNMVHSL
jgi:hypothetical protein